MLENSLMEKTERIVEKVCLTTEQPCNILAALKIYYAIQYTLVSSGITPFYG